MNIESILKIVADKFRGIEGLIYVVRFAKTEEEIAVTRSHHGIGRTLRNELGLWEKNEIVDYFHSLGIKHADDMSGIIMTSLHRRLNGREIAMDGQVEDYMEFWAKQETEEQTND